MLNWSKAYLEKFNLKIEDYELQCLRLCVEVKYWLTTQKIKSSIKFVQSKSNLESRFGAIWGYHAILIVDNYVHDAWCDLVMHIENYNSYMFPEQVPVLRDSICRFKDLL